MFKEHGGFLPATAPDRIAAGRFDVTFDFVFSNLDVQDLNVGKIQQLLELNLHCEALTDDCLSMTTISLGISRQLPKSRFQEVRPMCRAIYILILLTVPLIAQTDRAAVTGTVSDPSKAVIPGAQVILHAVATGLEYRAETTATGAYTVSSLPVGAYTM